MSDPFASASGATTATVAPGEDPFAQPASSSFPKLYEMFGCLLLIKPTELGKGPDYNDKTKLVDRITADVTILDGEPEGEWEVGQVISEMYLSQASLIGVLKPALRKNGMILGRLHRAPTKDNKDKYPTPEALEAAMAKVKPGQPQINYTWKLAEFTPEDAAKARDFLSA